jgi:hypothetical protein
MIPVYRLFWVSSLAYPNLLGTKGYVVVVVEIIYDIWISSTSLLMISGSRISEIMLKLHFVFSLWSDSMDFRYVQIETGKLFLILLVSFHLLMEIFTIFHLYCRLKTVWPCIAARSLQLDRRAKRYQERNIDSS